MKIICHADGDNCLGCAHYCGKADQCEFARQGVHDEAIGEPVYDQKTVVALIETCAKLVETAPIYHGQTGYVAIQQRDKRIAEAIRGLVLPSHQCNPTGE